MAGRRYVLPGRNPGLLIRGTINIDNRPPIRYRGGIATVRSITITERLNGREVWVLIPTVVGRKVVSDGAAVAYYFRTGQHLGVFRTEATAERYAIKLHEYHEDLYG